MGIRLVGECAEKFSHLNGNPYKALNWMCLRALDAPNPGKGIPAGLWFADWPELAHAMGWEVPSDPKRRDTMRNNVSKVCRELVDAGAIEKQPHPVYGVQNAAYALTLDPKQAKATRKKKRKKPVDNPPALDFDSVEDGAGTQVGNPPGTQVGNPPGTQVGNPPGAGYEIHPGPGYEIHPGPIKRNEEGTEEGTEEGLRKKGEDDTRQPTQPPQPAEPVDKPPVDKPLSSDWAGALAVVRERMAAASSPNARHARQTPVANVRPDRR